MKPSTKEQLNLPPSLGNNPIPVRPKYSNRDRRAFFSDTNDILSDVYGIDPVSGDHDSSSINTYSTTATMDDNPGTGRTIDTYFYQPAGRFVEKTVKNIREHFNRSRRPTEPVNNDHIELTNVCSDHLTGGNDYTTDDNNRPNDHDSMTMHSYSTNATEDDIPGAGRTLDTYFYQPAGRWIDKFALKTCVRLNICHPSPMKFLRYIRSLYPDVSFKRSDFEAWSLGRTIQRIRDVPDGKTIIVGLQSVVKQAQSGFFFDYFSSH